MALPTLNGSPKYTLTVPSTGKKVRYRPYLVKEEKVLLMASESKDPQQVLDAIIDTIKACTHQLKMNDLTSFDIEYIFIKLRAKSVGEAVTLYLPCTSCEQRTETSMNLDDVKCPVDEDRSMDIELNADVTVTMQYPSYKLKPSDTAEDAGFTMISQCIKSVTVADEVVTMADETDEEIKKFLESMTREQFDSISAWIRDLPQVEHTLKFVCENCSEKNEIEVKGLQNFF